jgi:hypothetical protein
MRDRFVSLAIPAQEDTLGAIHLTEIILPWPNQFLGFAQRLAGACNTGIQFDKATSRIGEMPYRWLVRSDTAQSRIEAAALVLSAENVKR